MAGQELFTDRLKALDFLMWAKPELLQTDKDAEKVLKGRDDALAKFGPIFREGGKDLNESAIKEFLSLEDNSHWTGFSRQQTAILDDFENAKKAIRILTMKREFNDNVDERFDMADKTFRGFGQGIITPILFLAYPDDYGVWNSKSESGLNRLGLGIVPDRGETAGRKYLKINNALLQARSYLNKQLAPGDHPIDLWTIDYFWHALKVKSDKRQLDDLVARFEASR